MLFLLAAPSGSGKTEGFELAFRSVRGDVAILDYDRLMFEAMAHLPAGQTPPDDRWNKGFWQSQIEDSWVPESLAAAVETAFPELANRGSETALVVCGYQFHDPRWERIAIDLLRTDPQENVERIFLNPPTDIVLANRRQRAKPHDLADSPEQMRENVAWFRREMAGRPDWTCEVATPQEAWDRVVQRLDG